MRTVHAVIAVLACATITLGQVDQEYWPDQTRLFMVPNYVRQEFTPTLDAMDSLQLRVPFFFTGPNMGGSARVNVREGGINGPIIGTSETTSVPSGYTGPIGFFFPTAVSLAPGRLYALEPVQLSGQFLLAGGTPGYSGGRLFFNGQFFDGDLIFREGVGLVPEPSTWTLALVGLGALLLFRRGGHRT